MILFFFLILILFAFGLVENGEFSALKKEKYATLTQIKFYPKFQT